MGRKKEEAAEQLTLAMRSGTPVSIPPCIRKPQGRPPSRMTRRTTFPLMLLLLLLLPLTTAATSSVPRVAVTTSVPPALMITDKKEKSFMECHPSSGINGGGGRDIDKCIIAKTTYRRWQIIESLLFSL